MSQTPLVPHTLFKVDCTHRKPLESGRDANVYTFLQQARALGRASCPCKCVARAPGAPHLVNNLRSQKSMDSAASISFPSAWATTKRPLRQIMREARINRQESGSGLNSPFTTRRKSPRAPLNVEHSDVLLRGTTEALHVPVIALHSKLLLLPVSSLFLIFSRLSLSP